MSGASATENTCDHTRLDETCLHPRALPAAVVSPRACGPGPRRAAARACGGGLQGRERADEGGAGPTDTPIGLRDLGLSGTLYATGVRAGEPPGPDRDDTDPEGDVVRVPAEGAKECTARPGVPAVRALARRNRAGRPLPAAHDPGTAGLGTSGDGPDRSRVHPHLGRPLEAAPKTPEPGPPGPGHTAATRPIPADVELRSVQESLGHATLAKNRIYPHVPVERLKATYAQAHPRA